VRRCLYCDFYILPLGDGPPSKRLRDFRSLKHRGYLAALDRELAALPRDFRPRTVYIGGGTPTELPPDDLRRLIASLKQPLDFTDVIEFTCEANPGTLDPEMAQLLAESGIDRVSLGVQSFDDVQLESLGRIHNAADACRGEAPEQVVAERGERGGEYGVETDAGHKGKLAPWTDIPF
jgi:oxygen-independent coproporphyrinogen-3 oxidase